jgi:ABC-type dipeptide/oligopeptide/nickel transport system ATPase subunit
MEVNRGNLGYLGIEFQYRLASHFINDKKYFTDVCDIIDNNMFTDQNLKRFVGSLMEYYKQYDCVPSYEQIEIEMRSKSKNDQDLEYIISTISKIKETSCEGSDEIKKLGQKFFRQQNFIRFNNKITELLKIGDIDRFEELEDLWQKALSAGNREEIGIGLRDNLGDVLSEDYRNVIPTGIGGIDEALEGGIGKGELGVIIAPSGFGKTTITTAMANYAASHGFKVAQIVFEDKEKQIQRKHIGKITGVEARSLSNKDNIDRVKDIMSKCTTFDDSLRIKKFNTGEISPLQIRNYIKRLINTGFKPDMVIIDYFECLIPSKNFKDQWTGEGHTMRQLEAIASDLDIGLWVPTQGTKDSINCEVLTMDKAGGSFKKLQIAHIVMSIARALEDIENCIATIAILKNRSGKSGRVMEGIYFNNGTCEIKTNESKTFDGMNDYKKEKDEEQNNLQKSLLKKKITERTGTTKQDISSDVPF